jgi:hypothetical protein
MLARKQELNMQLRQLIDALLLAVSLWVACVLRFYVTSWFHLAYIVRSIPELSMAFRGDMPFGPIMLELQGFYQSPLYSISILDGGPSTGDFGNQFCQLEHRKILPHRSSRSRPSKKPWSKWSIGSTSQDSRLVTWCNGCIGTPFRG